MLAFELSTSGRVSFKERIINALNYPEVTYHEFPLSDKAPSSKKSDGGCANYSLGLGHYR